MRFELPECRRCCLCFPLRHGILIFGYLRLLLTFANIALDVWLDIKFADMSTSHTVIMYRGVWMRAHFWLAYILYLLDVIFDVVLLVGAHKKSTRLMRLFYYYGIMTTLASFLIFIVIRKYGFNQREPDAAEWSFVFLGLVLQCYLLLLIRTELNKIQYLGGPFRYVNHVSEVLVDPLPPGHGRENLL